MPETMELQNLIANYVVPWGINIIVAGIVFVIGRWISKWVVKLVRKLMVRAGVDPILTNFVASIAQAALLLIVIIAALDQLGVDTTSLIAVMGAAGLAVGLALKDSLGNFASGVMMIVFRPFNVGDYIEAGGTAGTVESINIFSSTLVTPDNREVIVPNGAIYSGTIINYSARDTRRVDMLYGIGYGDSIEKAKEILNRLLDDDDRVLSDPEPVVAVAALADSSVNIHVRPWVKTEDYWGFLFDYTEKAKLAFDREGISIPFPQMDVHMDKAA